MVGALAMLVMPLLVITLAGCQFFATPDFTNRNKQDNEVNDTTDDLRVDVPTRGDAETTTSPDDTSQPKVIVPTIETETQPQETNDPVDTGESTAPYLDQPFPIQ